MRLSWLAIGRPRYVPNVAPEAYPARRPGNEQSAAPAAGHHPGGTDQKLQQTVVQRKSRNQRQQRGAVKAKLGMLDRRMTRWRQVPPSAPRRIGRYVGGTQHGRRAVSGPAQQADGHSKCDGRQIRVTHAASWRDQTGTEELSTR